MKLVSLLCFVAAFLNPITMAAATPVPASSGIALDGHTVSLPHDLNGRVTILILGFTQHSADTTTTWEKSVRNSLASTPAINYFDMPFLEDAPSFIRPLIVRSIRKQVPEVLRSHFVPLTSGETDWKQVVGFNKSVPDAAYVLLIDRDGNIRWQTHEAFTPARFDELSTAARNLAAR